MREIENNNKPATGPDSALSGPNSSTDTQLGALSEASFLNKLESGNCVSGPGDTVCNTDYSALEILIEFKSK